MLKTNLNELMGASAQVYRHSGESRNPGPAAERAGIVPPVGARPRAPGGTARVDQPTGFRRAPERRRWGLPQVLVAGASLLLATACGAAAGEAARAGQAPPPNPVSAPAPNPAPAVSTGAAPAPAGASNPGPAPQGGGQDLLAKGKEVFEKTAGGVGCAYCHGMDGKGAGPSGLNAPPIRGKTEAHVRDAVTNIVMMSFVKLTDDEIVAVGAYLQYLGQQP